MTRLWSACAIAAVVCMGFHGASADEAIDLSQVEGIESFPGKEEARARLARLGFIVVREEFKQIFQAYIDNPFPPFVTPDALWHAYHVILERGIEEIERGQAVRLRAFSASLLAAAAKADEGRGGPNADLARYAAVGLVLQDPRASDVSPEVQKSVEETVRHISRGTGEAKLLFFGLPVALEHFQPRSFYAKDDPLRRYFMARQWYAVTAFRLASDEETLRAVLLSALIDSSEAIRQTFEELTKPYAELVDKPDDPGPPEYATIFKKIWGKPPADRDVKAKLADFKAEAARLPAPRVNDQLLEPSEYARRSELGRSFRLLGARTTPWAALFQETVDPAVRGRMLPSGLDLFSTGPLASEAGKRALSAGDSAHSAAVFNKSPPTFPNSLHGRALALLGQLQIPLPATVPAPLRTPEWADLMLWSQLGGWAEECHAFALHAKMTVHYLGVTTTRPGMVAPYPAFFRGIADLAFRARLLLAQYARPPEPDPVAAGKRLVEIIRILRKLEREEQLEERDYQTLEESTSMLETFGTPNDDREAITKRVFDLEPLAKRAAAGEPLSPDERRRVAVAAEESFKAAGRLGQLADLAQEMAKIAEKQMRGQAITEYEGQSLDGIGPKLGELQFYDGNSYLTPRDDFPLAATLFLSPTLGKTLHAALGRPEALYVIVPAKAVPKAPLRRRRGLFGEKEKDGEKEVEKPFVLLRGAVFTYREVQREREAQLTDESWREQVQSGKADPPPAFTRSFRAEEIVESKALKKN